MKKEIGKKLGAIVAIMCMMMGNILLLGQEVYAVYEALESQGEGTSEAKVELDAYYKAGDKKVHSKTLEIGKEEKLYVKIKVGEGYLKEGQIALKEMNYKIAGKVEIGGKVKNVDQAKGIINLNDIEKNEEVEIAIPVEYENEEKIEVSKLNKESKVSLKGIYVDSKGKAKEITGEKKIGTIWQKEVTAKIEQEVKKYIKTEEGMLIETSIRSGLENNEVAVKTSELKLKAPEIEGKVADEVKVMAKSTQASNGEKRAESFGETNYSYNKETGEVTIKVENLEDAEGKVANGKGQDEYQVIYEYKDQEIAERKIKLEGKIEIETWTGSKSTASKTEEVTITQKGQEVSSQIEGTTKASKGYLYANNGKDKLNYESEVIVEISKKVEKAEIEIGAENFVKKDGSKEQAAEKIEYQKMIIEKSNIDKMLEETGIIKIYNEKEEQIGEITRKTQANTEGKIEVPLGNIQSLKVEIEGAKEGHIYLDIEKAVKEKTTYTKEEVKNLEAIEAKVKVGQEESYQQVKLEETNSKASLEISQTNLSSVIRNEKVELKGILETDSQDDELYKNPVVRFVLPEEITKVEINSINLLYSEELKIADYGIKEEAGRKVIEVKLVGEETKYHTAERGATILVNTNLEIIKTATSGTRKIEMTYQNEGKEVKQEEKEVEIVAPSGMITIQSLKGLGEEIVSIGGQDKTGKIGIQEEKKEIEVGIQIINNNEKAVKGVKIVGQIPNKEVEGSTFDTKILEGIEGASVYYSEKANVTEDVNDEKNGWTNQISQNSKSYLIEVGQMEARQTKEYSYKIEIPEKLNHNEESYGSYKVIYDNQLNGGSAKEIANGGKVGVTTGIGAALKVENIINIPEEQPVYKGQYVQYTVKVTNVGEISAENVKVTAQIPEGGTYVEYYYATTDYLDKSEYKHYPEQREIKLEEIESLEPNQSIIKTFEVYIEKNTTKEELKNQIKVSARNIEKDTISNILTRKIKDAVLSVATATFDDPSIPLYLGKTFSYVITVENLSNTIQNATIQSQMPEILNFVSSKICTDAKHENGEFGFYGEIDGGTYDEKTRIVTWELGKINPGEIMKVKLNVSVPEDLSNITNAANEVVNENTIAKWGENEFVKSNRFVRKLYVGKIEVNKSSPTQNQYIKEDDEIIYNITMKNTGNIPIPTFTLMDKVPDGIYFYEVSYTKDGKNIKEELSKNEDFTKEFSLEIGESISVELKAKADILQEGNDIKVIKNKVEVKGRTTGTVFSNEVTHTIESQKENKKYRISGLAWLDENKDGRRDDNEKILPGIEVKAINTNINRMTVNQNGETQKVYTNEQGEYEITNLDSGEYILLFEYDKSKYSLADYRKQGVEENRNNDVILGTVIEGGNQRKTGVTDRINIIDRSQGNIDIGLVTADQFDLRLDKYVSKITVQDKKGTKSYEYQNKQLGKVELDQKTMNGANIIIEYTIRVTNEGNVAGYAKKIADYMPKELTFKSELNENWYQSNGELLTSSLANEAIVPGQSKEVKLVLTKQMTENGTGNVSNKAEIKEDYNEAGLPDVDSMPGNKVDGEDDISKADVIIGIKTGRAITYMGITITFIATIALGAYYINKKVLTKEEF